MNIPKQSMGQLGVGIAFIIIGILCKHLLHSQFLTLTFHLAGGIMIALGILSWWMGRNK